MLLSSEIVVILTFAFIIEVAIISAIILIVVRCPNEEDEVAAATVSTMPVTKARTSALVSPALPDITNPSSTGHGSTSKGTYASASVSGMSSVSSVPIGLAGDVGWGTFGMPLSTSLYQLNIPWQYVFPYNQLYREFAQSDFFEHELFQRFSVPPLLDTHIFDLVLVLSRMTQQLIPDETDSIAELATLDSQVHQIVTSLENRESDDVVSLVTEVLQNEQLLERTICQKLLDIQKHIQKHGEVVTTTIDKMASLDYKSLLLQQDLLHIIRKANLVDFNELIPFIQLNFSTLSKYQKSNPMMDQGTLTFVIKKLMQRLTELITNDKFPPAALVFVLARLQKCDPNINAGKCLIEDMIRQQGQDFWTSRNELGLDALMLIANSDVPLSWIKLILDSGVCDVSGVSKVENKHIQFLLQHVNGLHRTIYKCANTVISFISRADPIPVKRLLKKRSVDSKYETMLCSFEGQEKYASKENLLLLGREDEKMFSNIMLTGTVEKSTEMDLHVKPVLMPEHFDQAIDSDGDSFTTCQNRYKFDPDAKTIDIELESVDVPENYCFNTTALLIACKRKRWDIVKLLVEKGADVNHRDVDGSYPLGWAIKDGQVEVAKVMIPRMGFYQLKKIPDKKLDMNHLNMAKYYGLKSVEQMIREARRS
ncbi:unnamed protein product [Sphagnum tenellum]